MGRKKKGFNWKARDKSGIVVDRSEEQKIKLDLEVTDGSKGYDESNVLALPTGKRKTKKKVEHVQKVKRLSKKERKKLEKVVAQKEKKALRAGLLESLSTVQATADEMNLLTSISEVQTGKFKRKRELETEKEMNVNTISGSTKKARKHKQIDEEKEESDGSIDTSDMSSDEEEEEPNDKEAESSDKEAESSKGQMDVKLNDKDKDVETKDFAIVEQKNSGVAEATVDQKNEDANVTRSSESDGKQKLESKTGYRPVVNIPVNRDQDIQEARLKLPILAEEQGIMEAINENPVVIVCGETGSGKTTQVPQFLYEAGYAHGDGIIGITEPRRVAAITMSHRVAMEMNLSSREVSYQIRYEGNVTSDTKVKFMTDGVLLKEVQQDFLLTKYSVIIIDEAHERSMYTDIMIGLLSRIVPLRQKKGSPLKLIIMSATLRVEDFTENTKLFKVKPPVIQVDARQYPVTVHFNKKTPVDSYLNEAYRKTCKIHRMLPEGGILVFVTGQQEVHTLCSKLKQTFPVHDKKGNSKPPPTKHKKRKKDENKEDTVTRLPKINLDNYSVAPLDEEAEREGGIASDLEIDDTDADLDDPLNVELEGMMSAAGGCTEPLYVLPLYSLLSTQKQARVFEPVPDGYRLCVVATNVAETSLTIPNIKYVVDTGKVKTKFYDKVTGVSTFRITWTSQAGANQRAGRAGRVGPGHCYRLFSSAVFSDFEKFSPAEITRRPVEDLVLQMKDMSIDKVLNFPYPTPPDYNQIKAAEHLLLCLGAVSKKTESQDVGQKQKEVITSITPLGRAMACFPVSPRYAKMLSLGHQHNLLPYVVAMVAALSVQEMFVEVYMSSQDTEKKDAMKQKYVHMQEVKRRWAGIGHSLLLGDMMVMLKAVGSSEYEGCSQTFCENHGIRLKAIREVRKLRVQLTNAVNTVIPDANICVDPKMDPPTDQQAKLLRQIVLAGLADHVARKCPDLPTNDPEAKKLKHSYQCQDLEEPVFIHPNSVLYRERPEFIVYQYIQETSKLFMKGIVAVEPEWLPLFAPAHVTFSPPMEDPAPFYDESRDQVVCHRMSTFGPRAWSVPPVVVEYPAGIDKYKLFAQFLLQGHVVKKLEKFTPLLLSSPSVMLKTWAKLQPRTEILLKALMKGEVTSRQRLMKSWHKDSNYLLQAFKEWIPESVHGELQLLWPPVT